jgi:MFS family permease
VPKPVSRDAEKSVSLWHPFRIATFRNLLAANVVSDVGTFMQSVGAAWLMLSLSASPLLVALTQTASSLPFFIFALPAGAIGDIVDRRKLVLFTETWMTCIAAILTVLTFCHLISPWSLLFLTFALSAGDAFESPTWRAILPELVPKEDLTAASALNGIEFNIARAIGPGLAGAVIAVSGVGSAFAVNTVSFLGVILVVARWRRQVAVKLAPTETLRGATVAAVRYIRYSPTIRLLCLRSGIAMFFASALLALLPLISHSVSRTPLGYGLLLGCFGLGAILGGLSIKQLRVGHSSEAVVSFGVGVFGLSTVCIGSLHALAALAVAILFAGAAWIFFISIFNVLVLNRAPGWVRARVMAVFLLVNQGALAGGSAFWGALASRHGLHKALIWAGVGALASMILGLFFALPDVDSDVTPWIHWKLSADLSESPTNLSAGPVLVTVEYDVAPEQVDKFLHAVRGYSRIRRRDGAYRWGIFQDMEKPGLFLETFLTASWGEHLRQHARATQADRAIEEAVLNSILGSPRVSHLISPKIHR